MRMNKFLIRLATESDVKCVQNIVKQSFVQYCNALGIDTVDALCESERDVLSDIYNNKVYLAYHVDEPIGTIRVLIKNKKAFIFRFAVLPEYQGLNVGSELLLFVENLLCSLQLETAELYSATEISELKNFYFSRGYCIMSTDCSNGYKRGLFRKKLRSNEK